jgi:hypothetical protein
MRQLKYFLSISFILILTLAIKAETFFPLDTNNPMRPENDPVIHFVGELFGGGVVFYVDGSKQHGLICSLSNIRDAKSIELYNKQDSKYLKGRPDSSVLMNQVFAVNNPDRANELCDNFTNSEYGTGHYSDWHLPSIDDLKILYTVRNVVNKSLSKYSTKIYDNLDKMYWSSTKLTDDTKGTNWLLNFDGGSLVSTFRPVPGTTFVRAIRSF